VEQAAPQTNLIETIPDAQLIRERLSCLMREQDLLRSLLRVAERKERDHAQEARTCR
jgi:hypothetical protein